MVNSGKKTFAIWFILLWSFCSPSIRWDVPAKTSSSTTNAVSGRWNTNSIAAISTNYGWCKYKPLFLDKKWSSLNYFVIPFFSQSILNMAKLFYDCVSMVSQPKRAAAAPNFPPCPSPYSIHSTLQHLHMCSIKFRAGLWLEQSIPCTLRRWNQATIWAEW